MDDVSDFFESKKVSNEKKDFRFFFGWVALLKFGAMKGSEALYCTQILLVFTRDLGRVSFGRLTATRLVSTFLESKLKVFRNLSLRLARRKCLRSVDLGVTL